MAWPNPFRIKDENTRHAWDYTFQWTPNHMTPEEMRPLKYSYDVLAEECLNRLDTISPPSTAELPRNRTWPPRDKEPKKNEPKRDLYTLLRDNSTNDEKLNELWQEVNNVPDWVCWEQIERGQNVFYRYGGSALTALAFQSLLGNMGANRVVETLARTGGFGVKVARRRMFELRRVPEAISDRPLYMPNRVLPLAGHMIPTTQHILQVTNSLESIKPGGAGHKSSIRVRLLHAAVRRRILKLELERPGYYDVDRFGVPINDLDSIATIAAFSASLIWLGFPRQGIWLRQQEIEDFIALWRLVAYYVGCPTNHFETPDKAKRISESLLLSEIEPSETSRILANNIIESLHGRPPNYASRDFLIANARWLNGNQLGDALGLGRPGIYHRALVAGQCLFFMGLCYTHRVIPSWDRRKIKALKRIFYAIIVKNEVLGLGEETAFDFQYIPDYGINTFREESEAPGFGHSNIERRNLRTLVLASMAFAGMSFFAWRLSKIVLYTVYSIIE